MQPEILSVTALRPEVQRELEDRFTVHRLDTATDPEALLDRVGGSVRGVVTDGGENLNAAFLSRLPQVGFISCSSAGYDGIDTGELVRRGIRLGNTSTALADDVADVAVLLLMAARRDLVRAHQHVTSGAWADGDYPLQRSFTGGHLGIVGMGGIGQAVARRAEAFGKEIAYFARGPKAWLPYRYFADLTELAHWSSDFVICLPGGDRTRHMVGAAVIHALGPRGVLVNVGRGSVVDEAALIAALAQGNLGAAGLDVFDGEPTRDPKLVQLPNITAYPHHASGTIEARSAMARLALENLTAYFDGRQPPCEVTLA